MKRYSFEPYDKILKHTLMKFGTGLKAVMENDFRLSWFAQTIFSISETVNFKTLIKVSFNSTFLYLLLSYFLF